MAQEELRVQFLTIHFEPLLKDCGADPRVMLLLVWLPWPFANSLSLIFVAEMFMYRASKPAQHLVLDVPLRASRIFLWGTPQAVGEGFCLCLVGKLRVSVGHAPQTPLRSRGESR